MSKISKRDSLTTTYVEGLKPEARGIQEFVFDHRDQRKVTPKLAPTGAETYGERKMNSTGRAAGPFKDEPL
jgi:hypothetical protein